MTPVWNDSARLARFGPLLAQSLAQSGLSVRWVIADDGSHEDEVIRLKALVAEFAQIYEGVELITCAQRYRKGGAIYEIWNQDANAEWFAFVDADGAIDAPTVVSVLQRLESLDERTGIIGVRQNTIDAPVQRPAGRVMSFKAFSMLVKTLLGMKYSDTQCGIKVMPAGHYRCVAPHLVECGFVFDVELLLAMEQSGCTIDEVAVKWSEMPEGKVSPLRDAWAMFGGLLRIRRRMKAGRYIY